EAGYKIIGVADIHGGLHNDKGFDVPKLVNWVYGQRKPLPEFPGGGEKQTAQEVLFHPTDILYPRRPRIRSLPATPIAWNARFYAKGRMVRLPRTRTKSSRIRGYSSFRTSWGT